MRAKKGGETGLNGEWYDGGQFLPSSESTVKGEHGRPSSETRITGKQEIAPYKWVVDPDGRRAIWPVVNGFCVFQKTGYSPEHGATGILTIFDGYNWSSPESRDVIASLVDRWNNGERFF